MQQPEEKQLETVDFFIPLPSNIGVPDGFQFVFEEPDDGSDVPAVSYTSPIDGLVKRFSARIMFRQMKETHDPKGLQASIQVSQEFCELPPDTVPPKSSPGIVNQVTVAHVSIITIRSSVSDTDLSDQFDKTLDLLRTYLKTYYLVDRKPLELPTRQNIPSLIMTAKEHIDDNGNPIGKRKTLNQSMLLVNDSVAHSMPYTIPPNLLASVTEEATIHHDSAFGAYYDAYREGDFARTIGNTFSAGIFFATAAEIFLDQILLLMLWEEGMTPDQAYQLFYAKKACDCASCSIRSKTTLDHIVDGLYSKRLGTDFTLQSQVLKNWRTDIAEPRNRIAHSGQEPTQAQMTKAKQALDELVSFTLDKLCENLSDYPVTTHLLGGDKALKKRGKLAEISTYFNSGVFRPTQPAKTYGNWRFEVERCQGLVAKKAKASDCAMRYLIHPSGLKKWMLVDESKRLFALIEDQNPPESIERNLRSLVDSYAGKEIMQSIIIEVRGVQPSLGSGTLKWHPLYLLSANTTAIDRWPVSYLLPVEN